MVDYLALSDAQLLANYKDGDTDALNALTNRYMQTARYIALSFSNDEFVLSDLTQEGMLGFLSAVHSFDQKKEVKFSTYASACMRNRILSVLRSENSKKRVPNELIVSFESNDLISLALTPEQSLQSEQNVAYISKLIETQLSTQERKVFRLFLTGLSYGEIAAECNISAKAVDSTLQRARKKLKEKL